MSAKVEVTVPGLLADCMGGNRHGSVEAGTIAGAIEAMLGKYPLLKQHLYDDTGAQRQHVLLFYNGENIAWIKDRAAPARDGDKLDVIQAVSGG